MTRPTVTLKLATSLDGRIATASGESRWITGEAAREEVHRLRASHHAVMVGSQTVIDDDPELTVRLPGYDGAQPMRVIADGRLRIPPDARVLKPAGAKDHVVIALANTVSDDALLDWQMRYHEAQIAKTQRAAARGEEDERERIEISLAVCPPGPGGAGVDPEGVLRYIRDVVDHGKEEKRILNWALDTRSTADEKRALAQRARAKDAPVSILLEGGGRLAASFVRAGLVDRIEWFRAPVLLGGDAKPALAALQLERLGDAPRFKRLDVRVLGEDVWERYERQPEA